MTIKIGSAWSVALYGVDGIPVTITARIGPNAPHASAVADARRIGREVLDRVRAAIRNSDLSWLTEQVSVSSSGLFPGGAWLADLAVACAVLAADGQLPADQLARTVLLGELGLDGQLRPVGGILPALLAASRAGLDRAIVPAGTLPEAALSSAPRLFGADRLADVAARSAAPQAT